MLILGVSSCGILWACVKAENGKQALKNHFFIIIGCILWLCIICLSYSDTLFCAVFVVPAVGGVSKSCGFFFTVAFYCE